MRWEMPHKSVGFVRHFCLLGNHLIEEHLYYSI